MMKKLEKILIGVVTGIGVAYGAYLFLKDYNKSIKETEKRLYEKEEFDYRLVQG